MRRSTSRLCCLLFVPTILWPLRPARATGWISLAPMTTGVSNNSAVAYNGKIYVAGGVIGSTPQPTLQIYDVGSNAWSAGADMPEADSQASGFEEYGGKLLHIGGYVLGPTATLQIYDPSPNSWTSNSGIPTGTATGVSGIIGGNLYTTVGQGGGPAPSAGVLKYDLTLASWSTVASMPLGRANPAGGVIDGKLYVAGGTTNSSTEAELDAYDPGTDSWTTLAPMPTAVSHAAAAVVGTRLYVMGGVNGSGAIVSNVQVYDPSTNTWTTGTALPQTLGAMAAAAIDNTIYVFGGDTDFTPTGVDLPVVFAMTVPEPTCPALLTLTLGTLVTGRKRRGPTEPAGS